MNTAMTRTNVVIDDVMIQRVMRIYRLRTKRAAIDFALRALVGERVRREMLDLEGAGDSIELVSRAHHFDALVAISGCDKTIPACVMALARLDIPGVMLYSGSIEPGRFEGHDVTIQDVYEAIGAHAAGRMTAEEL